MNVDESSRRYRVLHVTNFLDMSGQQENTLYTVSNLDQDLFEAHLAARLSPGDRKLDNLLARKAEAVPHLTLHDLPHVRLMPAPIEDFRTLLDLIRLMRGRQFEIVHTHANKVAMLGRLAAKITGVPIIVHSVHGWSFQYTLVPKFVRRAFLILEKLMAKITDMFVTVNQTLVEDGIRYGIAPPEKLVAIRSGMDLDRFLNVRIDAESLRMRLGLPKEGPIVGSVTLFDRKKSPESLVLMAPQVIAQVPDVNFLIVGDGEMMPRVHELVEEMNLGERVLLTGLREDVDQMMALMDVFVHPAWYEVLPRSIVQAQAVGIPVVATRLGGVPEVVIDGETGILVPPRDVRALADAAVRLLKDDQLRIKMGRDARENISSDYTIEAMVTAIESLYLDLMEVEHVLDRAQHVRQDVA